MSNYMTVALMETIKAHDYLLVAQQQYRQRDVYSRYSAGY